MKRSKIHVVRGLALAGLMAGSVLVSGCATTQGATAASVPNDKAREECIFSLTVRDWSALDGERLIIYGISRKEPYLVKLSFPSNDLSFAFAIGVYDGDRNGRICGFGSDAILIPRGVPDRITINSVQRITVEEAKRLTDEAKPKKKPKADKAAAAPAAK
jgi:hypothetical protein